MNIKSPPCYDIAGSYETVPDWGNIVPKPLLVIHKATEGNFYKDPKLMYDFEGMKTHKIFRGVYHFHRKIISEMAQAKFFCDYVAPILEPKDFIALDVEEGGESASQLQAWISYTQSRFPNNIIIIYSRKNILDDISMTEPQKVFFKKYWIWTAGYPYFPDLYSSPPLGYIPDTSKWGDTVLWQYSDNGKIQGIIGDIDCNWISPKFVNFLGENPSDTVSFPHDGIKRIAGVRYNRKFYLNIFDVTRVRFEVRHILVGDRRELPSVIAKQYKAQWAGNGDDWDKTKLPYLPKGVAISNGETYIPRDGFEPSLIFLRDGKAIINHINAVDQYNVTSGLRYIVQDGKIPAYLFGTELQYTERHARSINGIDKDGNVMRLTVDGIYPDVGVQLKEAAEIMISFGAITAFDTGGGGDSVDVLDGQVMNVPADIDNGIHVERRIPQFLLAYTGGTMPTPTDTDHFEYTATGDRAIRTGPGATYPRIEAGGAHSYFLTGKIAQGYATPENRVTLDAVTAPLVLGSVGDVWVKLYDNNGVAVDGWTAKIHKGIPQVTEVFVPHIPPTPETLPELNITIEAEGYPLTKVNIKPL